jgi:hypothetical protein
LTVPLTLTSWPSKAVGFAVRDEGETAVAWLQLARAATSATQSSRATDELRTVDCIGEVSRRALKQAFMLAALLPAVIAATTTVSVPRGVVVPILVTKDVRVGAFGTSPESHTVKLAVAQDVIVDGVVIAKAGDLAEGHYTTQSNQTKRTFETNVSQELTLDIDDIVNFCGDTVRLQFERTFVGGVRSGFLSFGVHGHDAVFGRGRILKASTDRFEKSVCAEATTAESSPLPRNIIAPDAEMTAAPSADRSDAPRVDGPPNPPPLSRYVL